MKTHSVQTVTVLSKNTTRIRFLPSAKRAFRSKAKFYQTEIENCTSDGTMDSIISRMQVLNREYKPLRTHTHQVLKALTELGLEHEWGYFAQHSVRNGSEWFFEHYPIPVITVRDICEIGFDLSQTFIEYKVSREEALEFDFKRLKGFNFEVYGVKEYLNDFYNAKQDIEDIHGKIDKSDEQEIGISLLFGYMESVETIINAVDSLQQMYGKRKAAQQQNAADDGDSADEDGLSHPGVGSDLEVGTRPARRN